MQGRSLVDEWKVQANLNRYWMMNSSYSTVFGLGANSIVRRSMLQLRPSHVSGSHVAAMRVLRLAAAMRVLRLLQGALLARVELRPHLRLTARLSGSDSVVACDLPGRRQGRSGQLNDTRTGRGSLRPPG
jgi:hypothetical protein